MRYRSALAAIGLICAADAVLAQTALSQTALSQTVLAQTVLAQAVLAPSGDSAITQPGGTEGRGARHSLHEAVRNGDVVGPHPALPSPRTDEFGRPRDEAPRRDAR